MFNIVINSVDKTSLVDTNSFKIRNKINSEIDECHFKIRKTSNQSYVPVLGNEVVITNNSIKIFGGVITKIEQTSFAGDNVYYTIKCVDYSQYLRRQLVVERYVDTTVDAIIDDMITNYTTDGFTTNNVLITRDIKTISFNNLTVKDCLDKIAKSLNAYWYVDYDKDIHFFFKNEEVTPFNLTDTSNNYIYESLVIREDLSQIRNKVTVKGGTTESTTDRTEINIVQDTDEGTYPLGNKFAFLPVVKINSVAITVGTEYVDSELTVDCVWNFKEKYIRFTDGNLPVANDKIEVIGRILIPVVVRIPNETSIAENGVFEYVIDDDTINSTDEAISRAITELDAYSNELNEGSFNTYTAGLKAGQKLNINSPIRDKSIDVIITEVKIKIIDPLAEQLLYTVKFQTIKTLGIIEYLQKSLIGGEVEIDAQETLLNYIQEDSEIITFVDDGVQNTTQSTYPYVYGDDAGNVGVWNFSSWV